MSLARYVAGQLVRRCLPEKSQAQLNRFRRRVATARHRWAKAKAIQRWGCFGPEEFRGWLASIGIRKGGVLLVQSSYDRFYNYTGTVEEIVECLSEALGPHGTLLMPAHIHHPLRGSCVFNVSRTPACTGILCELFRRGSGVRRSLHPLQSVCAKGPLAEALLGEHHLDRLSCGARSPYAKLCEYDGRILGLGLAPAYTTFLHVVEDADPEGYPLKVYAGEEIRVKVVEESGTEHYREVPLRSGRIMARINLPRFARHLSDRALRRHACYGVPAFVCDAVPLLAELRILASKGILVYG
jgi:aminoglycoside 3-N-acetyltransferase